MSIVGHADGVDESRKNDLDEDFEPPSPMDQDRRPEEINELGDCGLTCGLSCGATSVL